MPFVTTITLTSGDRAALDSVVEDVRRTAERKGIEIKGPHTDPPIEIEAPQFRRTTGEGDQYDPWEYTVYERTFRIVGHDDVARQIAGRDFPAGIHVEVDVDRVRSVGQN